MTPGESYRKIAAELRAKADNEPNAKLASDWAILARSYLRLAEQADANSFNDVWIEAGVRNAARNEQSDDS